MTIYPPPSPEGVRFVSIAVCMLFACPSLISQTEYETKVIQWLKWLSGGDSPFFGKSVTSGLNFERVFGSGQSPTYRTSLEKPKKSSTHMVYLFMEGK